MDVFGHEAAPISPAIQILNEVEHAQWIPPGYKCWNPCDAMLVGVFLFGSHFIRKQSQWHATVDLNGFYTRGQMLLDHLHDTERNPKNVRIIELVDAEVFKQIARWSVGLTDLKLNVANGNEDCIVTNGNDDKAAVYANKNAQ